MALSPLQLALSPVAGALSTLSPCVFPLLPMVVAGVGHAHHRIGPLVMGAGMVASFVVAGVVLAAVGPASGVRGEHVRIAAGLMLLAIAAVLIVPEAGDRTPAWLASLATLAQRVSGRLHPETLHGAFLLGALLGIIWSPCSGPLLGSGIALAATEGSAASGALVLGLFGLGAALPLVAVAYASRAIFLRWRGWVIGHGHMLRHGFAVLIGLLGMAVITGLDRTIEAAVLEILPDSWVELTTRL
ncbi:MAG: cytochrome c biogenesis protein CcdA [Rubrivivax sp.]|nr:cytochrome c biogenesis protein CcdA [Rubrivivax sp.]